jgi:hypothetical protein
VALAAAPSQIQTRGGRPNMTSIQIPTFPLGGKPWHERVQVHKAADIFRRLSDDELQKLGASMKDGRGRCEAGTKAGLSALKYEIHYGRNADGSPGVDPFDLAIKLNIERRHLTPAEIDDLPQGDARSHRPLYRGARQKEPADRRQRAPEARSGPRNPEGDSADGPRRADPAGRSRDATARPRQAPAEPQVKPEPKPEANPILHCAFCGKSTAEIPKLLESLSKKLYICNECTELATRLTKPAEEPPPRHPAAWRSAVESSDRVPCGFCDKSQGGDVYRLVDNDEVAICPACLNTCRELLAAKPDSATGAAPKRPLTSFGEIDSTVKGLLADLLRRHPEILDYKTRPGGGRRYIIIKACSTLRRMLDAKHEPTPILLQHCYGRTVDGEIKKIVGNEMNKRDNAEVRKPTPRLRPTSPSATISDPEVEYYPPPGSPDMTPEKKAKAQRVWTLSNKNRCFYEIAAEVDLDVDVDNARHIINAD